MELMKKHGNSICANLWSVLDRIAKGTYKLPLYHESSPDSGLLRSKDGKQGYQLVKKPFAKGNFGSLHEVENDSKVVVKVVNIEADGDEADTIKQTINEMVIHSLLYCVTQRHDSTGKQPVYPSIPAIHFLGQLEGTLKIVMGMERVGDDEYKKFGTFIVKGPESHVVRVFVEICDALQVLQNAFKFMHRDLHNNNIMLQRDASGLIHPIFIDFGYSSIRVTKCKCQQAPTATQTETVTQCTKCGGYNTALQKLVTDSGNMFEGHSAFNASLDLAVLLLNCEKQNARRKKYNLKVRGVEHDAVTGAIDGLIDGIKSKFDLYMSKRARAMKSYPHALYDAQLVHDGGEMVDMGTSPAKVKSIFHAIMNRLIVEPWEVNVMVSDGDSPESVATKCITTRVEPVFRTRPRTSVEKKGATIKRRKRNDRTDSQHPIRPSAT